RSPSGKITSAAPSLSERSASTIVLFAGPARSFTGNAPKCRTIGPMKRHSKTESQAMYLSGHFNFSEIHAGSKYVEWFDATTMPPMRGSGIFSTPRNFIDQNSLDDANANARKKPIANREGYLKRFRFRSDRSALEFTTKEY